MHMWKDDSKMDFKDIGLKGVEWIHVTEDKGQWLAASGWSSSFRFLKTPTIFRLAQQPVASYGGLCSV